MKEVFNWIANIIESCNNDFHFEAVDILIELFSIRYNDVETTLRLTIKREEKWNAIHTILS